MPWHIRIVIYGTAAASTLFGLMTVQVFQIAARLADQILR
jgi:hypothetical protein